MDRTQPSPSSGALAHLKTAHLKTMCDIVLPSLLLWVCCAMLQPASAAEIPAAVQRDVDFVSDVQPILQARCWSCHGEEKQESGLRLDVRQDAFLGGDSGKVIVPSDGAGSKLVQYVAGVDPDHQMPPEGKPLTTEQIGVLRAWIDRGARWPDSASLAKQNNHWAYQPLGHYRPPHHTDDNWSLNAIDQLILAKLRERNIHPSMTADRSTLIRRLNLDLLGLLPTLDEVDAFVNDSHPRAYEALVDRLLDSPHFGERWGRHWLDMARYADSDGYEKDNARPDAYRWRDWVIDAINSDMPFDQFTIEQLAGDLLPAATDMQRLATAFHRQTLTNTEGGTDQEQFRVEACFDRTETTGAVWLGLTVGCARCHSHKYDAVSQREYYQLFAFFNNGDEQTHVVPKSQADIEAYREAKEKFDVEWALASEKLLRQQEQLGDALSAWESAMQVELAKAAKSPFEQVALRDAKIHNDGQPLTFKSLDDGSVLVSGDNLPSADYRLEAQLAAGRFAVLRLDALSDKSLPAKGPGLSKNGNFVLSEVSLETSATSDFAQPRRWTFSQATADHSQKGFEIEQAFDGQPGTGWAIAPEFGKNHWAELRLSETLELAEPTYIRLRLLQQHGTMHNLGRFKISLQSDWTPAVTLPKEVATILAIEAAQRSEAQRQALLDYYSGLDATTKPLVEALEQLKKREPAKPELTVRVLAQRTQEPRKTLVLRRGEFLEPMLDAEVQPGGLSVLPPMLPRQPVGDRMDLAQWLVSTENPLTPRVTVNHVWRLLFGAGIVKTANDFGVRGDAPSHPELLDWLAREFIGINGQHSSGQVKAWSRKSLIRLIVMSATYRQSSALRRELMDIDPQNRWLARQNRLRVEGEIVRDISLDAAGLLSRKIGGPSVYPALPPGIAELSYAGNFKWTLSEGADRYRRGMYTFFKRTSPHPNLITFDCPDANLVCVDRNKSNTPLQALVSLNNESFAEAARALAKRVLAVQGDDTARITTAFRLCMARSPSDYEQSQLSQLLADVRQYYAAHPDEAGRLVGNLAAPNTSVDVNAAWVSTCRIMINLDEFITRE